MPDIAANGIRIHYERTGGDKPALVLLHGFSDDGQNWPRLVPMLQADYDIIMVDARGHGLSEAPESGYTADDLGADVAGLIRALGLTRPVVLGHSLGALATFVMAARNPGLCRALILEEPPLLDEAPDSPQRAARLKLWRDKFAVFRDLSAEQIVEIAKAHHSAELAWDDSEWGPWSHTQKQFNDRALQFLATALPRWRELLPAIDCPTLLVIGDVAHGSIVTPEAAQEAASLTPRLQIARIPTAGHSAHRERFPEFVAIVRRFLSSLS